MSCKHARAGMLRCVGPEGNQKGKIYTKYMPREDVREKACKIIEADSNLFILKDILKLLDDPTPRMSSLACLSVRLSSCLPLYRGRANPSQRMCDCGKVGMYVRSAYQLQTYPLLPPQHLSLTSEHHSASCDYR